MKITLQQLQQIAKNQKEETLLKFIDPLNELFEKFEINTPSRLCFYLANVLHECGEFRWLKETASGDAYDSRIDLGNTPELDGDGRRYKGRGLIMITGTKNYKEVSDFFKVDFLKNPELLEQPKYAVLSSGYFWMKTKLNGYCDENNFLQVVYRINGGQTHLKDRLKYLKLAFKTFQVPNYETILKDTFTKIEQNLLLPRTNHFKKMLFKAVPDMKTLIELRQFVNKL